MVCDSVDEPGTSNDNRLRSLKQFKAIKYNFHDVRLDNLDFLIN